MAGRPLHDRVAGAPISWGVCEAPGWGLELPADRVLAEQRGLGLAVTELGPAGWLGATAPEVRGVLERYGVRLVAGFVPVPMHLGRPADVAEAQDAMRVLAAAGASVVVLAARSADGSYDRPVVLDAAEWDVLLRTLDRLDDLASAHGLTACLHPHVGTAVEDTAAVHRVLEGSGVPLCLDTGHLLIGGTDPRALLETAASRVAHVHLKDVDAGLAAAVRDRRTSYSAAVRDGLYRPLGHGDVDVAGCVTALEDAGYDGWYVLEQDCALTSAPPPGEGPVEDVRTSLDFLTAVTA